MLKSVQKFVRGALILFFVSSILAVVAYRWVPVYVTPLMVIRCVQQVSRGEKIRLRHHWVPLDEGMSLYMPIAVMASEDQLFLNHRGFDFKQIGSAVRASAAGARAPFRSRRRRTSFSGRPIRGCARGWRCISPV